MHVNKLDSLETIVPYEYNRYCVASYLYMVHMTVHDYSCPPSFDFCEVEYSEVSDRDPVENLGQVCPQDGRQAY